jgi:Flp pilus assembly protein TadB
VNIAILIAKILLLLSIVVFIYQLMKYINDNNIIGNTATKVFNITEFSYNKRKKNKEKIRIEEGNVKDKSFINNIDLLIERSHIKEKLPFFNTEIYISLNIILAFTGFIIGSILARYWLVGVIIGMLLIIALYSILYIISGINYEKIDKEVLTFVNIMENHSGTNDDILTIMEKTFPYLRNPLKEYIEKFCDESTRTGDITTAFRKLELKIENERVRDIIRNIEICSRHESNYQEIIRDTRDTLKEYLKSKQQRKAIIDNGRMEMISCLIMSAVMIYIFNSFISNLIFRLKSDVFGNLILIYCVIIIGITIWNMIAFDKRG